MAAAITDLLRKKKSLFSTTLSAGINNSVQTIPLSSVSGLATDTAIGLTIDRVDANGVSTPSLIERVIGVISGSNLTLAVRGVDGTSGQSHSSGAVVEDIWDADTWNDMIDWALVEHRQDGTHVNLTSDTISEHTADNGVTIDGLKIKDAGIALGSDANGDIYYRAAGALARLAKGTALQVLRMNSGATAPEWATFSASPLTTKGDVHVYGSADDRLPVGSNGQAIVADSAQSLGLKWATLDNSYLANRTRNLWLGVGDFVAGGSGTPVVGSANGGNMYAWLLDSGQTEDIWGVLILPEDLVAGNVTLKVWWSMETATSGNVVLQTQASNLRDATAVDSIATLLNQSQTVAVPGAADTVKVTSCTAFAVAAGDALRIRVLRLGADGSDNASGDMIVYGVEVEYTADM